MKIISIIKQLFCYLFGFVCIITAILLFGETISNNVILDYSGKEKMNFFSGNHNLFKNIDSGFEDDFLEYTNQTEILPIQTLENIQTDQIGESVAVNLSALSGKYGVTDGKAVINSTKYDITSLLNDDYALPEINKNEPYILIYHTHTSEKYDGGGSVVDVGSAMKEEFENQGYKTIHLTDVFDKEQFSGAYSRSIVSVNKILEKYPTIKLVFDVHRDAITDSSGVKYRPITTVDDEDTAQVMFVCGTDQKGLSHPNWKENFKFALDVSKTLGNTYNGLSRPVNLRADRFNTHVTNYTFLIEMGSEKNTVEESKRAAIYTARSIVKTIEKSE